MKSAFWFAVGAVASGLMLYHRPDPPPAPVSTSVVVLRDELRRALEAKHFSDTQYWVCAQRLYDLRRAVGGAQ